MTDIFENCIITIQLKSNIFTGANCSDYFITIKNVSDELSDICYELRSMADINFLLNNKSFLV